MLYDILLMLYDIFAMQIIYYDFSQCKGVLPPLCKKPLTMRVEAKGYTKIANLRYNRDVQVTMKSKEGY